MMIRRIFLHVVCVWMALWIVPSLYSQRTPTPKTLIHPATIEGRITDPSNALVPKAAVTVTASDGSTKNTVTDRQGEYVVRNLAAGSYTVRIESPGFDIFRSDRFTIVAGQIHHMDAMLTVAGKAEDVTITASSTSISVDPTQNGSQLSLHGSDMDAFSDDSEDLANELQMLAGPSAGPSGAQIYIDGFTDGVMPPKQSIREIRINQNPFSAEYDKMGFGRVEIFTKPGSDRLRGQASINFGNRALTARNPYLGGPIVPGYQQEIMNGNLSGPLSRKASFFVSGEGRITDENAVLNYTALDTELNPTGVSTALITPSRRYSMSPRLDYALSPNHTLVVRYTYAHIGASNQGLSAQAFDEPSMAYRNDENDHNVQVSESAVFGASILNNLRFQFYRNRVDQMGVNTDPELDVQGAFSTGGTFPHNFTDRNRYELQNYTTIAHRGHTVVFGLRWRGDWLDQQTQTNFNGRFIFSSSSDQGLTALQVYQQNQILAAQGLSQTQIAAMGFGPSQFQITTGTPEVSVSQADLSPFIQDDWKVRPNLTLSAGLRYEMQNVIQDRTNFAPRVAIAWAPSKKSSNTVLRVGSGIFYDRFTSDLIWNATRQDGVHQTQYIIRNPAFFPQAPNGQTLAAISSQQGSSSGRAIYQIQPKLRIPRLIQTAASFEQNLPANTAVALTYMNTRGWHQLRTDDVNAPQPTITNAQGLANGPRPLGDALGDIYQYQGEGVFRQNQLIVTGRTRLSHWISLFGYYVYSRAMSDTDGPTTMPNNPYNLRAEYGRAAFDFRHRGFISGSIWLPFRVQSASFLFLQSGVPYNLISGIDTNNDGNLSDDRPAYAQGASRSSVVVKPGFGSFDTSPLTLANPVIVPRNRLEGPGILSLTVRLSRTWSFGREQTSARSVGGSEISGGGSIQNGGLGGSSNQSGLQSVFGGTSSHRPYNVTFSAAFRNALNNVNPAAPVGNLSSPYFGQSISLNTFGPLPGAGPSAGAGNRHIELQATFSF